MLKKVADRGKRSKTLSRVKLFENTSKNLQSFLEIVLCKRKSLKGSPFFTQTARPCILVIEL